MHPHSKINMLVWFAVIIVLAGAGYWGYKLNLFSKPAPVDIVSEEIPKGKVGMSLYENYLYNFKFEYPDNLYMKESEAGSPSKSQLSLVLVEGIKENVDLINGVYEGPAREGPTTIMLDVYENPKKLNASEWAKQDTNWNISSKEIATASVNGIAGVSYKWSGLYGGESVIITKGNQAYVFSVTWVSAEDQILKDFDIILKSFSFVE